jgi:4-azaleucine resistance transporter AzlC
MSVQPSFTRGVRLGIPYAVAAFVLSMSFGILARQAGFSIAQGIVASAVIFGGSAQFAGLAVLASGGTALAAVAAGTLMNGRFLAMGTALAPSLPGGAFKRAVQGMAMADSSWALSHRGDGSFDRWLLFGTTLPQYVAWSLGSVVGALIGDVAGDTAKFGLDAVFPTFLLAILLAELRSQRSRRVALCGAAIALAMASFTPTGVPILLAATAALWGLRR